MSLHDGTVPGVTAGRAPQDQRVAGAARGETAKALVPARTPSAGDLPGPAPAPHRPTSKREEDRADHE
jgi:hypothetical protein